MRAPKLSAVGLAVLIAAVIWTARSNAQEMPCDATCTTIPSLNCTTYVSYVCSTCIRYTWCEGFGVPGTQVCWDFAEEGTKITHKICGDGTHTDEWSAALCGSCYG
jgi:hypothetical protein